MTCVKEFSGIREFLELMLRRRHQIRRSGELCWPDLLMSYATVSSASVLDLFREKRVLLSIFWLACS